MMTTATAMTSPATATAPARVVPTVSQPVRSDWASWIEQFLAHEEVMIQHATNAGVALAEAQVPGGFIIKMFVTEQLVNQLVDQGIKALDGVLDTVAPVTATNPVAVYVLNMLNTLAPQLAAQMGPELDRLIAAALAKVGVKV